jgi:putative flippase GtrA
MKDTFIWLIGGEKGMRLPLSKSSSWWEDVKSVMAQFIARGGDLLLQNLIVYLGGLGTLGYLVALAAGSVFNFLVSYVLKKKLVYTEQPNPESSSGQMVGYGKLRAKVAMLGLAVTYLPLFVGVEFYITSTAAFVVNTVLLTYLSPCHFNH